MNNAPFIEAQGLCKSYQLGRREVSVLRGVTLGVERGEFLALRGASGAGKSTLLHLLGGLDVPNHGRVRIGGVLLGGMKSAELSRFRNRSAGFIFQAYHLLPEFDALENVCLPAWMARADERKTRERARELLQRVGLKDRLDHRPFELSGGEQQRVAIARALINQPSLVLADEPTGNLDSRTGDEIMGLLRELREESGTTLIIATHDSRVAALAPRVIELVDGLAVA